MKKLDNPKLKWQEYTKLFGMEVVVEPVKRRSALVSGKSRRIKANRKTVASQYTPVAVDKRYDEMSTLLEPKYREKIDVYLVTPDGLELDRSYYNNDLNSVLTTLRCNYFIDRKKLKVVSSCGYVEHVGEKHDAI